MTARRVLTLNAGSSSLKFALFEAELAASPRLLLRGQLSGSTPRVVVNDGQGQPVLDQPWPRSDEPDAVLLLELVEGLAEGEPLNAVGHRIVHGGQRFTAPEIVTARTLEGMESLIPLAPLHQPLGLAAVHALLQARPNLRQVCCFDTAFHRDLAGPVARYALPRQLEAQGIRRYGFHGLSYQYIAQHLKQHWPETYGGRVIVAHLGSGASLCAMRNGHSLDTTMGFSTLDGLVMATRPGSIDPGVLLYLLHSGMNVDQLEHLLYHECGLLGVSGRSGDVRSLLAGTDPASIEALELFVFSIARHVAALANTLGGLDALIFTGGVGEHCAPIRLAVAQKLAWLGVELSLESNDSGRRKISSSASLILCLVVPTDEEQVMAEQVLSLL